MPLLPYDILAQIFLLVDEQSLPRLCRVSREAKSLATKRLYSVVIFFGVHSRRRALAFLRCVTRNQALADLVTSLALELVIDDGDVHFAVTFGPALQAMRRLRELQYDGLEFAASLDLLGPDRDAIRTLPLLESIAWRPEECDEVWRSHIVDCLPALKRIHFGLGSPMADSITKRRSPPLERLLLRSATTLVSLLLTGTIATGCRLDQFLSESACVWPQLLELTVYELESPFPGHAFPNLERLCFDSMYCARRISDPVFALGQQDLFPRLTQLSTVAGESRHLPDTNRYGIPHLLVRDDGRSSVLLLCLQQFRWGTLRSLQLSLDGFVSGPLVSSALLDVLPHCTNLVYFGLITGATADEMVLLIVETMMKLPPDTRDLQLLSSLRCVSLIAPCVRVNVTPFEGVDITRGTLDVASRIMPLFIRFPALAYFQLILTSRERGVWESVGRGPVTSVCDLQLRKGDRLPHDLEGVAKWVDEGCT